MIAPLVHVIAPHEEAQLLRRLAVAFARVRRARRYHEPVVIDREVAGGRQGMRGVGELHVTTDCPSMTLSVELM